MATKYITVDICTLAGLKKAERLHQNGWKMNANSPWTIQFYKVTLSKRQLKRRKLTVERLRKENPNRVVGTCTYCHGKIRGDGHCACL